MKLIDRVRGTIREHDLMRAGTRVVAAVSGGSDSVALAHILRELHDAGELRFEAVVHFNHQLRPPAGDDERFVAGLAADLGRRFLAGRGDVAARAKRERRSVEDAARTARHEFFERACQELDADVVAVGHTRDDQAETFLLRLLRGAGSRGLASMYPRNGRIVRPFLACRRADLRAWLADRGVRFVIDESNADVSIPRNRIRAELIPLLESRFNPAIVDVLAGEASLAQDAWEIVDKTADEIASRIVQAGGRGCWIDLAGFNELPLALRRVVLWRAMSTAAADRAVGFDHVAAALRVAAPDGPAVLDAPGQRVERTGARLVLRERTRNREHSGDAANAANLFRYPLSIPGEVRLAEARCIVSAELGGAATGVDRRAMTGKGAVAVVRSDLCRGSLVIRNRRHGDRFRPVGLGGRKKLQDYFVDRKIRRADRDRVPIVVDQTDRIVWVAGYGIDEAFQVTDASQAVLLLRLRHV